MGATRMDSCTILAVGSIEGGDEMFPRAAATRKPARRAHLRFIALSSEHAADMNRDAGLSAALDARDGPDADRDGRRGENRR
jgi:hypothetical protein